MTLTISTEPGLEETASTTDDAPDAEHTPTEKDTRLIVARRVFYMLMHITDNLYVTVSDRLVNTVNRSVGADSGWTVTMVARQITRVARAHPDHAELLAHLCLRVTERLSNDLYDEDVRDKEGKPLSGGRLFRTKLLKSCESAFNLRLATLGLGAMVCRQDADEPEAVVQARNESLRETLEKVKSEGPGLVRFLGELSKIRLFSPFVVLDCLQELLDHEELPSAETAEDACVLLATVGRIFDIPRARKLMDLCFSRLEGKANDPNCPDRLQTMLKVRSPCRAPC